jgi:hypothetical protein
MRFFGRCGLGDMFRTWKKSSMVKVHFIGQGPVLGLLGVSQDFMKDSSTTLSTSWWVKQTSTENQAG